MRELKLQALQKHETQWGSGQAYLESVVRANELFDVIEEVPLTPGQLVEVLPSESGISGEALHLHPEEQQEAFVDANIDSVLLDGDE
ncbi:MAG: hypothetical protein KAI94_12210, partial [Anaerolineales bacterium]|nr:hypothetical protein [Anaerolineales bacterium]